MFYLTLLAFFVFFVFWLGDILLTLKVVKNVGNAAEVNPIIRKILSIRGRYIWIFKLAEIMVFLYLIYYVQTFSAYTSFYILLGYIFFYSVLVANNSRVFYQVTGHDSSVFRAAFVAISILLIFFIYLNYVTFMGLTMAYEKFSECRSQARSLLTKCFGNNMTAEDEGMNNLLGSFDIPIPSLG